MELLIWIIIFCLVGGVLGVFAAALVLLMPVGLRTRTMPHMISFAIGALLGAAFLALLPDALDSPGFKDAHQLTSVALLGILGFFLLEKTLIWRHCHTETCEVHGSEQTVVSHHSRGQSGTLVLIGDGIHNFVDGILIAGAFLTDIHLGVVTSLAVAAHEIPQEVGDFFVLLQSGYSKVRALWFNVLSGVATVVGGVLGYFSLVGAEYVIPYLLTVAASSFIYIAVADLIPGLHHHTEMKMTIQQMLFITAGVLVIYIAHSTLH